MPGWKGVGKGVLDLVRGTIHNCHLFIAQILRAWFYGRLLKWIFQHTQGTVGEVWGLRSAGHLIGPFDRKLRYVSGLSSLSLPPCLPLFRSLAPACFYYKRAPPAAQACNFFLFLRCCFRRSPSAVLSFGSLCLLSRAGGYRSPFLQGSPLLSPSLCALRKIILFSVSHYQSLELNIIQFWIVVRCLELYF